MSSAALFRELYPHDEFLCNLRGADKEPMKVPDSFVYGPPFPMSLSVSHSHTTLFRR